MRNRMLTIETNKIIAEITREDLTVVEKFGKDYILGRITDLINNNTNIEPRILFGKVTNLALLGLNATIKNDTVRDLHGIAD